MLLSPPIIVAKFFSHGPAYGETVDVRTLGDGLPRIPEKRRDYRELQLLILFIMLQDFGSMILSIIDFGRCFFVHHGSCVTDSSCST